MPEAVAIIGVVPDGFAYPFDIAPKLWIPLGSGVRSERMANNGTLQVVGRLREDATIERAQTQVETLTAANLAALSWPQSADWRPVLVSFFDTLANSPPV